GDLALEQVGPLELPLLSPSPDGSFQPLTPTSGWGGHTQRPWRRGITGPSWSGCGDRVVIGPVQELSGLVTKQSGHRAGSTSAISTARSEANWCRPPRLSWRVLRQCRDEHVAEDLEAAVQVRVRAVFPGDGLRDELKAAAGKRAERRGDRDRARVPRQRRPMGDGQLLRQPLE